MQLFLMLLLINWYSLLQSKISVYYDSVLWVWSMQRDAIQQTLANIYIFLKKLAVNNIKNYFFSQRRILILNWIWTGQKWDFLRSAILLLPGPTALLTLIRTICRLPWQAWAPWRCSQSPKLKPSRFVSVTNPDKILWFKTCVLSQRCRRLFALQTTQEEKCLQFTHKYKQIFKNNSFSV